MKFFSCILFDFEGVLFDPHRIIREAYNAAFNKCHENTPSTAFLNECLTFSPYTVIKKLQLKNPSIVLKEYEKIYLQLAKIPNYVVLYENVLLTLKTLKRRGVKIGVVTSQKKERFVAIATQANILPLLNVTITPSECGLFRMKPKPFGIEMALRKVGEHAANSAFVGDSPEDMIAAKKANVFSIGALWGLHPESALLAMKPDYLCRKIEDILQIEI